MGSHIKSFAMALVFAAAILPLVACGGGVTSSVGDKGELRYSLYTTYQLPQTDLRDVRIVTGHQQRIDVSLTLNGRHDINNPEQLVHSLEPSTGTTVKTLPAVQGMAPSVDLTVSQAGDYTLESRIGSKLIDDIPLHFAQPGGFEMNTQVRAPWSESFNSESGSSLTVEQGSQVVILPIPIDSSGNRLAGDLTTSVSVTPHWAVTPGVDVLGTYEQGLWTANGEINFYFIEPATVTFTISDPVSKASSDETFTVTPVVKN